MANGAQIHLLLNHFPVILPIAGLLILLVALKVRSPPALRVAYCLILAAALLTIPTYLSGEPAEAVVKNYPDVSRRHIEEHEAAAKQVLILLGLAGLGSAVLLGLSFRRRIPTPAVLALAAGTLLVCGLVARAAHLGGEIRHEEIRDGD